MSRDQDPCDAIRARAEALPGVTRGSSCNQDSFKVGRGSFLYIGPGPKGVGYKAMFKLERSMPQAEKLAGEDPDRFEVGSTGWVTTRFTKEKPLPKSIWEKWLRESFELTSTPPSRGRKRSGK
jgi:hypothetical protein